MVHPVNNSLSPSLPRICLASSIVTEGFPPWKTPSTACVQSTSTVRFWIRQYLKNRAFSNSAVKTPGIIGAACQALGGVWSAGGCLRVLLGFSCGPFVTFHQRKVYLYVAPSSLLLHPYYPWFLIKCRGPEALEVLIVACYQSAKLLSCAFY